MTDQIPTYNPEDEISEYMARFKDVPPEQILKYMGELRDFFQKYMTPEGREFFEKSRFTQKNR